MLTTLSAVKVKLGIVSSDTSEDAMLNALIVQADRRIKTFCRRDLESASYTEYPRGYGTRYLRLVQAPVTTITSVHVDRRRLFGADSLLVAGEDYDLVNGRLVRLGGAGWPGAMENHLGLLANVARPSDGIIKIVYVAGYDPVPADLTLAAEMLVARLRGMAEGGKELASESLEDHSYSRLTPPMREGDDPLLTDVIGLLRPYRRLRV